MRISDFSFGSVRVDGVTYDHDLIIDRGRLRKRKKAVSKKFRHAYGHTPLSIAEDIPWQCRRLVIGTGANGRLPVPEEVETEPGIRSARRGAIRAVGGPGHEPAGKHRCGDHHRSRLARVAAR
jgi:hypothetical protein